MSFEYPLAHSIPSKFRDDSFLYTRYIDVVKTSSRSSSKVSGGGGRGMMDMRRPLPPEGQPQLQINTNTIGN